MDKKLQHLILFSPYFFGKVPIFRGTSPYSSPYLAAESEFLLPPRLTFCQLGNFLGEVGVLVPEDEVAAAIPGVPGGRLDLAPGETNVHLRGLGVYGKLCWAHLPPVTNATARTANLIRESIKYVVQPDRDGSVGLCVLAVEVHVDEGLKTERTKVVKGGWLSGIMPCSDGIVGRCCLGHGNPRDTRRISTINLLHSIYYNH